MQIDISNNTETQTIRELRRRIAFGYWQPGDQLPKETLLANELGISRATLNKALNQLDREGFFRARRGCGRFVTIPPKRRKLGVISIVLSDIFYYEKPTGAMLIRSIQETISKGGYSFRITALNPLGGIFHYTMRQQALEMIHPSEVDGLIVITQSVEAETALELSTYCPVVWFHHPSVKPGLTGVRYDWIGGSYQAMKHLIENGHRRIALVNIMENFVSGREQLDGARLAIKQLSGGDRIDLIPVSVNVFEPNAAYEKTMQLLENKDNRPTAIICGSDDFTPGIYRAITSKGLTVPSDISLVSWNDTLTANEVPIPLDSVSMDFKAAGTLAAEGLITMISEPEKCVDTIRIDAELVKRNSVIKI